MSIVTHVERAKADLHDAGSFDHVGRDVGAKGFVSGRVLSELAVDDDRIVAGCADLKYVTQLAAFEANHPERFFQFGISERNMMGAAAGLATTGLIPYVATFACFSGLLAFENIRTDHAYPRLKVRVLATHAGIAMGFFGTSHHATEDVSALRAVSGLTVLSPCNAVSTEALLRSTVDHEGPIYFRLGRGREDDVYPTVPENFGVGVPSVVRTGTDVLLVATGSMVGNAVKAADELAARGISVTVLDVHTLKPFDGDPIAALAATHASVVVVEEHNIEGGLGSMVAEALGQRGVTTPVHKHGLRDEFALVGPPTHLYRYYGLDPAGIATCVVRAADNDIRPPQQPIWTDDDRRTVIAELTG